MFEDVKQQMLRYALKLDQYGLVALSGGNLSARVQGPDGDLFVVTPSGMIYDEMVPSDMLVMDIDGTIVEGTRKASVDTEALLYIYAHMPRVNAVIHTHQPYATGLGLVMDEIPCNLSTTANAVEGPVAVAPYGDARRWSTSATAWPWCSRTTASYPWARTCVRRSLPACTSRRRPRPCRSPSPRACPWPR